jgi:site-specific DNA-adenine methylase
MFDDQYSKDQDFLDNMHHDVKSITKKQHLQQQQQLLKRTTVMNNSTRFKLTDGERTTLELLDPMYRPTWNHKSDTGV